MAQFTFMAPTLFEAAATARDRLAWVFHDSPDASDLLAKHKKFTFWLKGEMDKKGLATSEPEMDEGGWMITRPSEDGFTLCIISNESGGQKPFDLLVTQIGDADEDCALVCAIVETILGEADEVSDLRVDRDT